MSQQRKRACIVKVRVSKGPRKWKESRLRKYPIQFSFTSHGGFCNKYFISGQVSYYSTPYGLSLNGHYIGRNSWPPYHTILDRAGRQTASHQQAAERAAAIFHTTLLFSRFDKQPSRLGVQAARYPMRCCTGSRAVCKPPRSPSAVRCWTGLTRTTSYATPVISSGVMVKFWSGALNWL